MTIPRQLAPIVGPAHGGFQFLKGSFEGIKGYAVGRMTKSRRGKLYIDDADWGPNAGSVEYGYRVPFDGIHVFIGKIGEPGPEPDICTDLVEMAQRARSARVKPVRSVPSWELSMEGNLRIDQNLVVRPSFIPATSHRPDRPSRYISYKMAGLGAVPMATVFRTPLICQTGLRSSWPVRNRRSTLRLQRR